MANKPRRGNRFVHGKRVANIITHASRADIDRPGIRCKMGPSRQDMKLIHTAKHPTEAHLIRGMLEAEGIRALVRGDQLYGAYGELPVLPTVWIFDDAIAMHADQLVMDFLRGTAARKYGHQRWICAQCGENLEGQFTDCWKCGAARPSQKT